MMGIVNAALEERMLIGQLTEGWELATQLKQLDPVESREACEALVEKIVSTYDKALSVLNLTGLERGADQVETFYQSPGGRTYQVSEHQDFQKDVLKKRKTLPQRNEQVRVCSGGGLESPMDDGHSWRKYGQKDILGATFPRAYYRCTHRNTQGCLATKQVQRSQNDSSLFQITYKGRHTCIQSSNTSSMQISIRRKLAKHNISCPSKKTKYDQTSRVRLADALCNRHQGLKVETEAMSSKEEIFSSFSYPPLTQIKSDENVDSQFLSKLMKEDHILLDCSAPAFLSPNTSDFNSFSSDWLVDNFGLSGESEFSADMILAPTSATESPLGNLDFCFDQMDFDTTTLPLGALGYFSR